MSRTMLIIIKTYDVYSVTHYITIAIIYLHNTLQIYIQKEEGVLT